MKPKIAIVHPLLKAGQIGGGERVNLMIAEYFDADIFVVSANTTWWNQQNDDEFVRLFLRRVAGIGGEESHIPIVKKITREQLMQKLGQSDFAQILNQYDVVIFADDIRYLPQIITKPRTIFYRHTLLSTGFSGIFNNQTLAAMRACDIIISNSQYSALSLKSQFGSDSVVVFPPVDTSDCKNNGDAGYFLYAARLETHKGIRETVAFFTAHPQYHLKITGDGSQKAWLVHYLAQKKPANIEYLGVVDRAHYFELLSRCHAFVALYAHEAFGISPVEALACGKPVLALSSGALPEIIAHQKNGYIVQDRTEKNILDGVQWIDANYATIEALNASQTTVFAPTRFFSQLSALVQPPAQKLGE